MALNDFSNNNNNSAGGNGNAGGGFAFTSAPAGGNQTDSIIDLMINYNEMFKNASPTLFRERIIQQSLSILISKLKPNLILNGAAGVGKTRIVEEIARLIANDAPIIPDALKGHTVYELPLNSVLAGTGIRGQMEERLQGIVAFLSDTKEKAILFIDEIHQLVNFNGSASYEAIAQALKPALARGQIKIIGATTLQEMKEFFRDPAFSRRFNAVSVPELTQEQTVEILRSAQPGFNKHYGVMIPDKLLPGIVQVADEKKKAGMHRPDNAITLFDRALGDTVMEWNMKKEQAKADPMNQSLQILLQHGMPTLTSKQIKLTAIRLLTGNDEKSDTDQQTLSKALTYIKGQDESITYIRDVVARRELGIVLQTLPETFLFCGPSGVGKTETAKIIARTMTGTKPIILNMTEYDSPDTINKIIGSPPGYIGSDRPGELPFDILESNPYQVILLDEFEKCHSSVQRLFMSAFDEGYIRTSKGAVVDFSKSIVIATTNAGVQTKHLGFNTKAQEHSAMDLSGEFDKELLNRFRHILHFNKISKMVYADVIDMTYNQMADDVLKRYRYAGIPTALPLNDLEKLVESSYEPAFGCRPAKRTVQTYIEDLMLSQAVPTALQSSDKYVTA